MSISAPSPRRWWLPTAAVAVTVVAIAGVAFYLNSERAATVAPTTGNVPTVAAPGIEQAGWHARARSAGGQPTAAQRRDVKAQGPEVVSLVKSVYNAMFLAPEGLKDVLSKTFTQDAARALAAADTGLPKSATEVQIKSRKAEIGIDINGAGRAAARVRIVATGLAAESEWHIVHRSTLWLERANGKWRVIGFDMAREPGK